MFNQKAGDQRDGAQQQVVRRAKVLGVTAAKRAGADGEQRVADGRHHRSGHHRRDDPPPVFGKQAERSLDKAAHQHRADHRLVAVGGADIAQNGDKGKADAHDNRQPRADPPDRIQLNQRRDARHKHRVLQQHRNLRAVQSRRRADHGDRGQVRHKHRQHMLQAEGNRRSQRHPSIQLVDVGGRNILFFWKCFRHKHFLNILFLFSI